MEICVTEKSLNADFLICSVKRLIHMYILNNLNFEFVIN